MSRRLVLIVALLGLSLPTMRSVADERFSCLRIAGADRDRTAQILAELSGPAPTVAMARDDEFADALAGAYLGVPVLLTPPDQLAPAAAEALADLQSRSVVLLGGQVAISAAV